MHLPKFKIMASSIVITERYAVAYTSLKVEN